MTTDASDSPASSVDSLSNSGAMTVVSATPRIASKALAYRLIQVTAALCVCGSLFYAGSQVTGWLGEKHSPCVLPGEFEQQDAILFAWPASLPESQRDSLIEVIAACTENVRVVVLIPDSTIRLHAWQRLDELGVSRDLIQFVTLNVESPWIRDFGPLIVKSFDGEFNALDMVFDENRPVCAEVPQFVANRFSIRHEQVELILPGGNILSNGAGFYVSTNRLLKENHQFLGYDKLDVDQILTNRAGAKEVVYLTPLQGESSGHVDLFATFTAPDSIVIGQIDPKLDPVNARILDDNANRLEGMPTAFGPLQVKRIPMPPCSDGCWRTYTNVIYANGVVVVPTYEGADPETERKAIEVYEQLLRGWQVKTVEATPLSAEGGGPRNASVNIFRTSPN